MKCQRTEETKNVLQRSNFDTSEAELRTTCDGKMTDYHY